MGVKGDMLHFRRSTGSKPSVFVSEMDMCVSKEDKNGQYAHLYCQ